ncbi:malto-oligosyltrehalose synthase [Inquilinus sp. CAU 1745]|uniref:malto-oligosyltrehalose synthase n=1 Tax=Inquilinus sp. CAU 1745 TaxID=3140369 RepID=UPI00325A626B
MPKRPLRATYRVQFNNDFTFADAERLVPYFRKLGVSHLYASPIFAAQPMSAHGYDIVDHEAINPALGGEAGFRRLADALHEAGMGIILDIVPNHAGVGGSSNARWLNVLEFGRRSRDAKFFDIDWSRGPLVLPFLGEDLEKALADDRLKLRFDRSAGRVVVAYGDEHAPLRPRSVALLLRKGGAADAAKAWMALEKGPLRVRDIRAARSLLRENAEAVEAALARMEGPDRLAELLSDQHFRFVYWRTGVAELNYRRFFDVTQLAGLRVEEPAVFDAVHRLPVGLVREGLVDGLRVDHIDGLADPEGYCDRLRSRVGPDATIHVEKILGEDEALRPWPVDGTTGYETLNLINRLFVDPAGYDALKERRRADGLEGDAAERTASAKRQVLKTMFPTEIRVLTGVARRIAGKEAEGGNAPSAVSLRAAILELAVAFPVYRSYVNEEAGPEDQALIDRAVATALSTLKGRAAAALAMIRDWWLSPGDDSDRQEFVRRMQQLTGPAMAKGYEDTELYRSIILASVNEVGSHLHVPAITIDDFHRAVQAYAHAGSLIPLSTHDTKRGADTRARLNLLSEVPEDWIAAVNRWRKANRKLKDDDSLMPDALDEELVYQTLFGVWPVAPDRIAEYLTKAVREAKRRSSWSKPDARYEAALLDFARALLEVPEADGFRGEMAKLVRRLDADGRANGIAQTVLQLTLPGVPDIYRGSEYREHVLVDPDNRRPVDWAAREASLDGPGDSGPDAEKQRTIRALLDLRARLPEIFAEGLYEPLEAGDGILAFARMTGPTGILVAVPVRREARKGKARITMSAATVDPILGPATVETTATGLTFPARTLPLVAVIGR